MLHESNLSAPVLRAQWLAEVEQALEQASDVVREMRLPLAAQAEARDLFGSIEAARLEARSLRQSRSSQQWAFSSRERLDLPADGRWLETPWR
jgi:hypothetical protein